MNVIVPDKGYCTW